MELIISSSGHVRCVYSEELDLTTFGPAKIQRASHVEPTADGHWTADLSPVYGPILGPFLLRSEALEAEIDWLKKQWLTVR